MADLATETQPQDDTQPTDNRSLLLGLLLLLLQTTQQSLQAFSAAYIAGTLTLLELHDGLVQTLQEAHAHSSYLGRQLAGDSQQFGTQDVEFAQHVMDDQAQYLEGLLADYESGRYVGEDGAVSGALDNRLTLYARGLRHTANASWLFSLEPTTLIEWHLHAAEHCQGCLDMDAGSPYPANEIPALPGDLECGPNCQCDISTVDGDFGFPHMDF